MPQESGIDRPWGAKGTTPSGLRQPAAKVRDLAVTVDRTTEEADSAISRNSVSENRRCCVVFEQGDLDSFRTKHLEFGS